MGVIVGSARISENGTVKGVVGDQTGKECATQPWYLSNKGWIVIRPTNPTKAKMIADNMAAICIGNVGYSQAERTDLYNKVKPFKFDVTKLTVPANVDCSEAVRVCSAYAGIMVNSFTTANEVNMLNATGEFDILTSDIYCKHSDFLKRGDILVTRSKGHTVVVLCDGNRHNEFILPQLQKGDKGCSVKRLQKLLNEHKVAGGNLVVDGDFGLITLNHLIEWQAYRGLKKDGVCGNQTWGSLL